jgi:hypothetical protein
MISSLHSIGAIYGFIKKFMPDTPPEMVEEVLKQMQHFGILKM